MVLLDAARRDRQGQHMLGFRSAANSLNVWFLELVLAPKNEQATCINITLLPVCEGSAVETVRGLSGAWRIPLGEGRWLQERSTAQPDVPASEAAERKDFLGLTLLIQRSFPSK